MSSLFTYYKSVEPINKKIYFPSFGMSDNNVNPLTDTSDDYHYYRQQYNQEKKETEQPNQDWFTVTTKSENPQDYTDYTAMDLQTVLNNAGLNNKIRITSGYRERNINPNSNHGKKNKHGHSMAYDIVPIGISYDDMFKLLTQNELVNKWLFANGFNINDETSEETRKITHGTGPHYHVGPDKFNIKRAKKGLKFDDSMFSYYQSVEPIKQEQEEEIEQPKETLLDRFLRFFNSRDEIQPLIIEQPTIPHPDEIPAHPEAEEPTKNIPEQEWFNMPEFNNDEIGEQQTNINDNNYENNINQSNEHFINWLKSWEGGYTSSDGGTNMGVTFNTWKRNNLSKDINNDGIIDKQDLQKMPESDFHKIVDIYKKSVRFDDIKDKNIAQLLFQFAWGSGSQNGIKLARKILGLKNSSVIDNEMIEDLNKNPQEKFEKLKEGRRNFLNSLNKPESTKRGWMRRLDSMHYNQPWELNK